MKSDTKVPFSNKVLAFRALQHGIKYSYNNWQMWANLMIVSIDVGELVEACRAMECVVEERADKDGAECVDIVVLECAIGQCHHTATKGPGKAARSASGTKPKHVDYLF